MHLEIDVSPEPDIDIGGSADVDQATGELTPGAQASTAGKPDPDKSAGSTYSNETGTGATPYEKEPAAKDYNPRWADMEEGEDSDSEGDCLPGLYNSASAAEEAGDINTESEAGDISTESEGVIARRMPTCKRTTSSAVVVTL